jgi:replicative DNA helicase
MQLSGSIPLLKRKAKLLSRQEGIFLHEALDRVAAQEGFSRWSLLVAKASTETHASKLYAKLKSGDLLLIGARPRQGKTLFGLRLLVEAMKSGRRSVFFSLEYTKSEMQDRFSAIGVELKEFESLFEFDGSDGICADHIMGVLAVEPRGAFAVVDYLQLLDQKRNNPDLSVQVRALQAFARERGHIFVFISQIDRAYDASARSCPDLGDVRLPNPLDLNLFAKTCFLHNGEIRFQTASYT